MSSSKEAKESDVNPSSMRARSSIVAKNKQEEQPGKRETRYPIRLNKLQGTKTILNKSVYLPTENWVDILKLFSRRELVRRVQLVTRRLHYISEQHVDTRHKFKNFWRFLQWLTRNLPSEQAQRDRISDSLARHYAIDLNDNYATFILRRISGTAQEQWDNFQRRNLILDVLRKCPNNLFSDCHLYLKFVDKKSQMADAPSIVDYMAQLHKYIRPFCIRFGSQMLESDELFLQPLFLNIPRLKFSHLLFKRKLVPSADAICKWLHHQLSSDESGGTTRIFYLEYCFSSVYVQMTIIEQCKQLFVKAKTVADRRAFLFLFDTLGPLLENFEMENLHTCEMLKLECHESAKWDYSKSYQNERAYVLRRCLATDLANTADDQFCSEMVEQMGAFHDRPMKNGKRMPILDIL